MCVLRGCVLGLFWRKPSTEGALFWEHKIHPSGFRVPEGQSCQEWLTFKGEEAVFYECCASLSKVLKTWSECKLYRKTWRQGAPGNLRDCGCELLRCTRFRYRGWNLLLSQEHSWCWHPFRFILLREEEKEQEIFSVCKSCCWVCQDARGKKNYRQI